MPVYGRQRTRQTSKALTFPASVGGMNALDSLIAMPIEDCVYCNNLMPSEYGMRLRKGYREWASGLGNEVRTVLPFEGQAASFNNDRLFAVTEDGIYDITLDPTVSPLPDVTFTSQEAEAGFGVSTEFTNDAAERIMMYADGSNGLHQYNETGDNWTVPTLTGIDVTNVAFVMAWKNRLWFIEQNSADGWYLPPDASSGTVTKFTFGSKFTHGGELMGLFNWTIDGGDGVDDFLLAISRGGDVLIYHGSDPSQPDFGLRGSYFIGEVPESRRIAVEYGGELYLLSTYGITSVSDLLQGVMTTGKTGPAAKISRFLRQAVQEGRDEYNWSMHIHPADGFLQVITPYTDPDEALQYNQNLLTRAWGRWKGVPVNCAETWNGEYFIGDKNGSVHIYDGFVDGETIAGDTGDAVEFNLLTSFQAPENHATYKRVGIIRPIGVLAGTASVNVKAVYDYAVDTVLLPPVQQSSGDGGIWDTSNWDEGLWDFSLAGASLPVGALGMGRSVAIGMKGSSFTRLTLLGWDVTFTTGDFL